MIVLIDFDEETEMVNIESTPPMTQDELVDFLRDCIDSLTDPEPVH